MLYEITDTKTPIESIRRFKFITRKENVNTVFEIVTPHLTNNNYKECYTMLLKRTTYKDLKVYFAKKLINYFKEQNFTISKPITSQLDNLAKKAAEIKKKKLRTQKAKKKSKNKISNKKSLKNQLDRLNGVAKDKKRVRNKSGIGGSSEDLTTKSSIWAVKKR